MKPGSETQGDWRKDLEGLGGWLEIPQEHRKGCLGPDGFILGVGVCPSSAGQWKAAQALPAPAWSLVYGAGEGGKARWRRPEPVPGRRHTGVRMLCTLGFT